MTSYFEIGGHIVECETTPQSSLPKSRVPMIQSREAADSRIVGEEARPSLRTANSKDSLFIHWLKTGTYPVRQFADEPRIIYHNPWTNPRGFIFEGIGVHLKVAEMHYDYFVKGESHEW